MINNNPATSSVSIILNKIDLEKYDTKLLESYNSVPGSNVNKIEEKLSFSENLNTMLLYDLSDLELDKLCNDLQIKPSHWTDDYWHHITEKYAWFIHKDSYIGCKICYNVKTFMGKKSLIGTMKLFLMDLSYEDLEQKLMLHNSSSQHTKSIMLFRRKLNKGDIEPTEASVVLNPPIENVVRRSRPIDYYCPLCQKGYKMKKALAKHICHCNNELGQLTFNLPCQCHSEKAVSIVAIDEHNVKVHSNSLLFVCKVCSMEFKQTTVLFGHLLMFHDIYWNPYEEMPSVVEAPILNDEINKATASSRPERKKSVAKSADNIYIMYGPKAQIRFPRNRYLLLKKPNRKRQIKDKVISEPPVSEIRIERVMNEANNQSISKLTISQSSILTCEYCGGRYLSQGILNDHIDRYHSTIAKREQELEVKRQEECRERLKEIVSTGNVNFQSQHNKTKIKTKYIRLSNNMRKFRAIRMKKNFSTGLDSRSKKIIDDVCRKINKKDYKLLINKRSKVSASMLICPSCHASFATLDLRFDHVSVHHPELEKFSCKICGLIFTNQTNYRRHLEKSHNNSLPKQIKPTPEKTYSCENCHLVFTNQADLSHHLSFSHPDIKDKLVNIDKPLVDCDMDAVVEPPITREVNKLELLINASSMEQSSHCSNCRLDLHNPFELLVHSYTHDENCEEFQGCPNCNRLFFGKQCKVYLKDHYNSEHLKKPLPQCAVCKLSFTSSYALEKHQSSECQITTVDDPYSPLHLNDKLAFSCSQCGLIFAGQSVRERFDTHMKICRFELMDNELLNS